MTGTHTEETRAFTHGSGGANADMAVDAAPVHEDQGRHRRHRTIE